MEEVLNTVGTEIINAVIGLIIGGIGGGAVGYKIGVKNKVKQTQKARENSSQIQIGSVNVINGNGGAKYE